MAILSGLDTPVIGRSGPNKWQNLSNRKVGAEKEHELLAELFLTLTESPNQ